MNTNGHYNVIRGPGRRNGVITHLGCAHCTFLVRLVRRSGDRSGLGKYNRARAEIVKHLHAYHRAELAAAPHGTSPIR